MPKTHGIPVFTAHTEDVILYQALK